jgi:hypothetical protein
VLVDRRVVASWSVRADRVVVTGLEEIAPADRDAIEAEREALEAFHQ